MANIDTGNNANSKKNKAQKKTLRVDFTPMVDMNMLLITFFMFCTTLSIPQVMDIAMPADSGGDKVPESKSVTLLLGEKDKVYYYAGVANYEDYTSLKETDISGMRKMLLERNVAVVSKMKDLKRKFASKQISDKDFEAQMKEIKKSKEGIIVVIKPTKDANFENLVDVLDEMQICGVDRYAILDLEKGDNFLMENYKTKGSLTAMATIP